MQVFLEKTGILGPVYRLMGRGLSDSEIAYDLDIPQVRVHDCIDWMRHFLHCKDHNEVAQGGLPRSSDVALNLSSNPVADLVRF